MAYFVVVAVGKHLYPQLLDYALLYSQYVEQGDSAPVIARRVGCCPGTVRNALSYHGIVRGTHKKNWKRLDKERAWRTKPLDERQALTKKYNLQARLHLDADEIEYVVNVLLRDQCAYCDAPAAEIDHIVPQEIGGDSTLDNLTAVCRSCNSKKKDSKLLFALLRWRGYWLEIPPGRNVKVVVHGVN